MRKIPATMATQHPDNALPPFWDKQKDPFVAVYKEIPEAVTCFEELGVSEYMWDWEGKHADAAVIDRLFSEHYDYFSKHQLGRDKFLTFRIPNVWEEKGYNLLQAMTVVLSGEDFARDLKFEKRPLFEVILPMTERAEQLMRIHKLFEKLARFKSSDFTKHEPDNDDYLELIPLIESVQSQLDTGKLLEKYASLHKEHFDSKPVYLRPFFARSDPSLVSGMLSTVLANKIALSQAYSFSKKNDVPVFPISGVGSLPFRGGLSPDTVDDYISEHPGMRTVTVQSSFRYDNPIAKVKDAITELEEKLPKTSPVVFDTATEKELTNISCESEKIYQKTLMAIAGDMKAVFASVPKRRERRQHIGLLAYGRKLGEQKMPRAITFTAGFYSIGVPPEFISTGRALSKLNSEQLNLVRKNYRLLKSDLQRAGKYLNRQNLSQLAERNDGWKDVQKDIELVEKVLGIEFGVETKEEKAHEQITAQIIKLRGEPSDELKSKISEATVLRKSLG